MDRGARRGTAHTDAQRQAGATERAGTRVCIGRGKAGLVLCVSLIMTIR